MKLRVKLHSQSRVVELNDRNGSDVSLNDLKSIVASHFELGNQDFHLSLNKKDALPADDSNLSSFGIVSGDLIHIIGDNLPQAPSSTNASNRTQPLAPHSSSEFVTPTQQVSDVSMASVSNTEDTAVDDSLAANQTGIEVQDGTNEPQVNRCLLEPLVVRESTSTQVPVLLDQLYHSSSSGSQADALWVVVHALMLESGFQPLQVSEISQIPESWKQSGFYRCSYQLKFSANQNGDCSVVGVLVGSSIIVHGLTGSESPFKTEQLQLKPSDYVNTLSDNVPAVYSALDRLSRIVKDTICFPLENELSSANGVPSGQGFTSLPYEVKLRILSFLDALTLCRLAQTRSDMGTLASERELWRRVYIREFGKPDNSVVTRNWYELYKEAFIKKKKAREQRRHLMSRIDQDILFGIPSRLNPHPRPDPRFPPRIIGGNYDIYPDFAAGGVPNPMGSGHNSRRPGPLLPNAGIPAPGRRDLDDPFRLPLGPRGNLTGSPFSGGGGRSSHHFW